MLRAGEVPPVLVRGSVSEDGRSLTATVGERHLAMIRSGRVDADLTLDDAAHPFVIPTHGDEIVVELPRLPGGPHIVEWTFKSGQRAIGRWRGLLAFDDVVAGAAASSAICRTTFPVPWWTDSETSPGICSPRVVAGPRLALATRTTGDPLFFVWLAGAPLAAVAFAWLIRRRTGPVTHVAIRRPLTEGYRAQAGVHWDVHPLASAAGADVIGAHGGQLTRAVGGVAFEGGEDVSAWTPRRGLHRGRNIVLEAGAVVRVGDASLAFMDERTARYVRDDALLSPDALNDHELRLAEIAPGTGRTRSRAKLVAAMFVIASVSVALPLLAGMTTPWLALRTSMLAAFVGTLVVSLLLARRSGWLGRIPIVRPTLG